MDTTAYTGTTPDQIIYGSNANSAIPSSDPTVPTVPDAIPSVKPLPSGPQPNTLERLLPLLGSVGGSVLGSFLGPLGMVGGGAGGSALGQELENLLSGSKGSTLGAGVAGGVGSGIGLGVSSALGALGGTLTGKAAEAEATAADQGATQDVAANFGGALNANKQIGLKLGDNIDLARELGFQNPTPQDFINISKMGTGQTDGVPGFLNYVKQQALDYGGPVDLSPTDQFIKDAIGTQSADLGDIPLNVKMAATPAGKLYNNMTDTLQSNAFGNTGSLNYVADPQSAFKYLQDLGAQSRAADSDLASQINRSMTGSPDPVLKATADAYREVYQKTSDLLYNRPQVQGFIQQLNDIAPEDLANPTVGATGQPDYLPVSNPKVQQYLADTVNNANQMSDVTGQEAQLVKMSQAGKIANDFNTQAIATPAALKAGAAGGSNNNLLSSLMAQPGMKLTVPLEAIGAFTHNSTLEKLGALPLLLSNPALMGKAGGLLSGLDSAGIGSAAGIVPTVAGQVAAHAPTLGAAPTGATINQGQGNNMNVNMTDPQELMQLAAAFPGSEPMVQQAINAQSGVGGLGSLQQAFQNAGGAQGFGGGLLSQLSGYIPGTAAYQYRQQQQAVASVLAQILGKSPGAIQSSMPSLMSNPQTANIGFQSLLSQISPAASL